MSKTNLFRLTERLTTSLIIVVFLFLTNVYPQVKNEQITEKAKSIYQKIERIEIDSNRAVPSTVRGILAVNVNLKNDTHVRNFLQKSAELFMIDNKTDNFETKKVFTDEIGMTHLKLQQKYKGIPVWGSELVLHSSSSNEVREINGRFTPKLNIDVNPSISADRSLEIALNDLDPAEYRWLNPEQEKMIKEVYKDDTRSWKPEPELMIAPMSGNFEKGEYRLVWKMTIAVDGEKLGNYEYFIDAKNSEIINKFNSMPDAVGSGISNYNGIVTIYSKWATSTYQMQDTIRSIKTYTANNTSTYPGNLLTDSDNYWDQNNSAVDVHWGIGKTYDFYKNIFNRASFDDNGAEIRNTVNYYFSGSSYPKDNAAWNGAQFLYGDGEYFFSSVTSLDVAAHEFTHAVTQYSANLIYQGESGALNEAISDIFGTVVEFYATPSKANWLLGEECYTPGISGDALRYMDNPNNGQQPDTYGGTYWASTSGGDYGGVHTNSGVLNYTFYLMSQGGSGTNDNGDAFVVSGIGIVKSRAIAYRALTIGYLTSSSNYSAARNAFLSSASDLYGSSSAEYKSVSDAFGAVGIGVRYVAKNNFNTGTIKINGYTTSSGSNFFASNNSSQTLEAIEQYYNPYDRVWNISGVQTSISNWRKQASGEPSPTPIQGATNISYTFTATQSNHNTTYIADLKKNYKISRNDQTEFDGTIPAGVVAQIVEQNPGQISSPTQKIVNGRTYRFAGWSDGNGENPRTITPINNETYTALYKIPFKSNDPNAYTNNSQRKFVRTTNGYLHMVYESLGHVWYERSTDNGFTWEIMNSGKPLDTGGGKLPAIAYRGNNIGIVWQEIDGGAVKIQIDCFGGTIPYTGYPKNVFWDISQSYSNNLNPVIAWDYNGRAIVAWENKSNYIYPIGIVVKYGPLGQFAFFGSPNWDGWDTLILSSTDVNSINPTISVAQNPDNTYQIYYKLAWQQTISSSMSAIKYISLMVDGTNLIYPSSIEEASSGSGFWENRNPSITVMDDNTPRLSWVGYAPWYGTRALFRQGQTNGTWSTTIWNWGSNVIAVNTNKTDNGNFVIGWSQNNISPTNNFVKSSYLSQIHNFNTTGNYLQVNNAPDFNSMYALAFKNQVLPYYFTLSSSVGSLPKINSDNLSTGRSGVIIKDNAEFCFVIGDVKLNDKKIDYINIDEGVIIDSLSELNEYIQTEPFLLKDNSTLSFSILNFVIPKKDTNIVLTQNEYIKYKLVLIDDKTEQTIGILDSLIINNHNDSGFYSNSYSIDSKGIGNKKVRIKILLDGNLNGNYVLGNFVSTENILNLPKQDHINLSYRGNLVITDYALDQNYPNPFNPSTIIKYQIPKDGLVTLKVYDILGREVAALVDEHKSAGYYDVSWDASNMPSGVYIYRLSAGTFTSVKKMLLIR